MSAFACKPQLRAPAPAARARRTTVVVSASLKPSSLAAAGAAALLLSSSPAMALDSVAPLAPAVTPIATLASETAAGPGDKGLFTKLLDALPSAFPKVPENRDPFNAERAQERTVADTLRPIPIPTEQEAVAPEAFPNPSEAYSPRPPVLAAAEGDEHLGENAGQFSDLDASGRQSLIDKQSPAQSSTN